MVAHLALYREWRPQRFADIVGQQHLTRTLQNALHTNRFAHAYLFSGPRGTGKTSAAKILARAVNCERGPAPEPCNECDVCRRILDGTNMDVREIDAASNRGVDEIREIRDKIKMVPTEARYKVYIIDEVHMLTTEAFNALLKTLEEPPQHVMFILATTEPHKLPATVISRCQRFDFRRIQTRDIVERLKSIAEQRGAAVEEEAYWIVARYAEGGMRDALSLFDQVLSGGSAVRTGDVEELVGAVSLRRLGELSAAIADQDQRQALLILLELLNLGKDPAQLLQEWTAYFRDLLLWKTAPELAEMQDRVQYEPGFPDIAAKFTTGRLVELVGLCGEVQTEFKWQTQGRLLLELLVVRLCRAQDDSVSGLQERVARLEQEIEQLRKQGVSEHRPVQPRDTVLPSRPSSDLPADPAASAPHTEAGQSASGKKGKDLPPGLEGIGTRFAGWDEEENQARLKAASANWVRILERVKQVKIQTQAWLINGEPVAAVPGYLLVAFKNQIHQETCLKEMHREIIEKVLFEILEEEYQLTGILAAKWEPLHESMAGAARRPTEPMERERQEEQRSEVDDLIRDVVNAFGSDIVKIVD